MDQTTHTAEELSRTTQTPRRTIRYYVQLGLIPAPDGTGKGARYGSEHLERLLTIRRLRGQGFSLERIAQLLEQDEPAPPAPSAGDLRVVSRMTLAPGLTLEIDPERAGLAPEQVRRLGRACLDTYNSLMNEENPDDRSKN